MRKGQQRKKDFPKVKGLTTKKTKNGHRYLLSETDETGKTHSITVKILETDDEKTFLKKVEDARMQLRKNLIAKTFQDYLNEFLAFRSLSKSTENIYKYCLRGFSLDDNENEKKMKELLKKGKKQSTMRVYCSHVDIFYKWLIEQGIAVKNPARNVIIKYTTQTRTRIMTDDEIMKIMEYAKKKKPLYRLFILLLLHTGARVSTVLAIKKKDLTKKGIVLYNVKCKRYYDYAIPIDNKEIRDLWQYCMPIGSIFGNHGNYYRSRLNTWLRRNFERDEKGESISIHTFRHTFASRAAMNNVPIEIISKLLDHQSVAVTAKYYARFSQKQINDGVKKAIKGLPV